MGIKDMIARVRQAKKLKIKAGVLGGAHYIDSGQSVAEVAMYNEYGTSHIPSRPFLRITLANHADEWAAGMGKMMGAFISGKADLSTVGDKMGVAMQTGILETIDSSVPPPNAESTLKRKLSRLYDPEDSRSREEQITAGSGTITTLKDSGLLRDSISYDYDTGTGYERFLGDE